MIVNKAPETYIIGAPAETSGGYFHFHVYWYGTDVDGQVTQFVWALTDTSIQDHTVDGDEEDSRFNPATNVSTLRIGHYTTRTDTVFDFQISQGANLSYDMTLHMVARDDRGDFDRTPARLHFISNALSNPSITFYQALEPQDGLEFANLDTIGYGQPFAISWRGNTANIRSYSPEMLAERDTVPPVDGLYGYKYRLMDLPCNDTSEDCWQPRNFDAVAGDSVSYFGRVTALTFSNDDSDVDLFHRRLAPNLHQLLVNTIDVAGVEVPPAQRILNYVVNYDPQTRLLRGEQDPFNADGLNRDAKIYPYYIIFRPDGSTEEHPFAEDDTVPDKAYVVFKALGWDDSRDLRTGTVDWEVKFQAAYQAVGLYGGQTRFPFDTQFSDPVYTPEWARPAAAGGGAADTIGFQVGPFEYNFVMRTVDEHGRRDGTPETFRFFGNYPPCVQCAELLMQNETPASNGSYDCYDQACAALADTIYGSMLPSPAVPPGWRRATSLTAMGETQLLWYNSRTGSVWLTTPASTAEPDSMPGYFYEYRLALHGADHPEEPYDLVKYGPVDRIKSWRYQIQSERDANNAVSEGGGIDAIGFTTFTWAVYDPLANPPQPIAIDDEGVWMLRVKFFVPETMAVSGVDAYLTYLQNRQLADYMKVFGLTTAQMGLTTAQFIAQDASNCAMYSARSAYHIFTRLRVPLNHGLSCGDIYVGESGKIRLSDFMFTSETNPPYSKRYVIKAVPLAGPIFP